MAYNDVFEKLDEGQIMSTLKTPSLIERKYGIDHPTNVPIAKENGYVYWPN